MKIKKNTLLIIAAIFLLAIIVLGVYLNRGGRGGGNLTNVQEYKKVIYDSLMCQYSCPLAEVNLSGKTEEMPDGKCINSCLNKIRETGFNRTSFSEGELLDDDFVYNVTDVIETCRQEFMIVSNESVLPDSKGFYGCGLEGLNSLKKYYGYLN